MLLTEFRMMCDKCKEATKWSRSTESNLRERLTQLGWQWLDGIGEWWCNKCISKHNAECKPGEEI